MKRSILLMAGLLTGSLILAQTPGDNKISREQEDALPGIYPVGAYMFDSEAEAPWSWPYDAGVVLGLKFAQTNFRHSQLILGNNPSYFAIRSKSGTSDSWSSWRRVIVQNSNGLYGVGTNSPQSIMHVSSDYTDLNSTSNQDANLIIEATSNTRSTSQGAALGFVVPANADGSNPWQQGRILVAPDNTNSSNATGRMYLQTRYYTSGAWHWRSNLVLKPDGSVGIGTETPTEKLEVNGTIRSKEVKVEAAPWPDYVFSPDYELKSLEETESYIKENQHLPGISSAEEVSENGIALGEMNAKLLEKVEELTLHQIELLKLIKNQQSQIDELKKHINK